MSSLICKLTWQRPNECAWLLHLFSLFHIFHLLSYNVRNLTLATYLIPLIFYQKINLTEFCSNLKVRQTFSNCSLEIHQNIQQRFLFLFLGLLYIAISRGVFLIDRQIDCGTNFAKSPYIPMSAPSSYIFKRPFWCHDCCLQLPSIPNYLCVCTLTTIICCQKKRKMPPRW